MSWWHWLLIVWLTPGFLTLVVLAIGTLTQPLRDVIQHRRGRLAAPIALPAKPIAGAKFSRELAA
ncbi:hypothetical protein ACI789_18505 [Geodermatophilus sp. SYSU D00965]